MEDLLQEFGRAGRDRKPSVSVIFHEGHNCGKDVGRLKFMADTTVEAAPLDIPGKAQMLDQRYPQMDQAAAMPTADECFRESIRDYFGDNATTAKRSLAEPILDWVFGSKAPVARREACCDFCDRELLKRYGVRTYVAAVVGDATIKFVSPRLGSPAGSRPSGTGLCRRGPLAAHSS